MEESNKNNKKRHIPKWVKKARMKPTNQADIDFEWDFGHHSPELSNVKGDYSKPSTSSQSEEPTLISREHESTVPCHVNDTKFSFKRRKKRVRFDIDSSNSEKIEKPWIYYYLATVYPYDNIYNLPYIGDGNHLPLYGTESFWNPGHAEVVTNATRNTFCNNQPGASRTTYSKKYRNRRRTKSTWKKRFEVQKVNSAGPPFEYVASTQRCNRGEKRSLQTRYPRLKSLKRAINRFFYRLTGLIERLRATKGKCIFKPKMTD